MIMKRIFKGFLSFLLCISLVIGTAAVCAPNLNAGDNAPGTDTPLIYLCGTGDMLVAPGEDGTYRKVYGLDIPEDYVQNIVKENIGLFTKAVLTQQWDDFCDLMYNSIAPLYSEIKLDENGRPTNSSKVNWSWSRDSINAGKINGKYGTTQFTFHYDWRLDPLETAEKLHAYIEDVMAVTGAEKVGLLGRCLGSCIVAAYMQKYDAQYIKDLIVYTSAINGVAPITACFSGDLYLDPDGLNRLVYDTPLSGDTVINQLIDAFVTVANATYGLDLACWSVNNVWPELKLKIMPRILRDAYASWPSYWAMVGDEGYEEAKKTVFYGADAGKYANFIDIIDNYHYNVQQKVPELFKDYEARGIDIYNVSKYGFQDYPIRRNSSKLSDSVCDLDAQSAGATTAPLGTTLDDSYITAAGSNGTAKYISPDRSVDASTCLFPDRTWFIKNLKHADFPDIVNRLFDLMINEDDFDVNASDKYPQYLVFDRTDGVESISPMTADNMNTDERYKTSFFDALVNLIRSIVRLIIRALSPVKTGSSAAM